MAASSSLSCPIMSASLLVEKNGRPYSPGGLDDSPGRPPPGPMADWGDKRRLGGTGETLDCVGLSSRTEVESDLPDFKCFGSAALAADFLMLLCLIRLSLDLEDEWGVLGVSLPEPPLATSFASESPQPSSMALITRTSIRRPAFFSILICGSLSIDRVAFRINQCGCAYLGCLRATIT